MPKKRRTPKQRAASRRNLVKARAARKYSGIPTGKTMMLYHRTTPKAAEVINIRGFRNRIGRGTERYKYGEPKVFGSNTIRGQAEGYGKAVVSFKVSRKHAALDDQFPSGERHYAVDPKNIKVKNIKYLTGKRAKR